MIYVYRRCPSRRKAIVCGLGVLFTVWVLVIFVELNAGVLPRSWKFCSSSDHIDCSEQLNQPNDDAKETASSAALSITTAVKQITGAVTTILVSPSSSTLPLSSSASSADRGSRYALDLAVCIPWAVRIPPSITNTVRYLVDRPGLNKDRFRIIVWRSWPARHDLTTFEELVKLGVGIFAAEKEYGVLEGNVRTTRRDPPDQMRWRLRHVLDYANLLEKCSATDAQYLLLIEDDLLPAHNALQKALDFGKKVLSGERQFWSHAALYSGIKRKEAAEDITSQALKHGNVALILQNHYIPDLTAYLRKEAFEWPADMLTHRFFTLEKHGRIYERTPNIFQHASQVSTYTGKNAKRRASHKWRSRTFRLDEDTDPTKQHPPRAGDKYIGCFYDNNTNPALRDLTGLYYVSGEAKRIAISPAGCRKFCKEYLFFGLQQGLECYCGNEFGRHGIAPEKACNQKCKDDPNTFCGGILKNSIYAV